MNTRDRSPRQGAPARTFSILLALVFAIGCAPMSGADSEAEEDSAIEFTLESVDGSEIRLADYRGRAVLLDFWATWCTPCRAQAEVLEEIYAEVRGESVEFLAIDSGESAEKVAAYVERSPFSYPVLIDEEDTVGFDLDVIALPTVIILDGEGKVTYTREGLADAPTLRRELAKAGAVFSTEEAGT